MHRATSSFPVPVSPRMITGKVWSHALPMRLCIVPIREETPMRPPGLTVDSNWLLNAWRSRWSGSGPAYRSSACASSAHKKLPDNRPSPAICTAFAAFGGFIESKAEGFWGFKLKHRGVEPFDEVHRCCWRHISPLCACLRDDNDFADPDLSCLEHTLTGTGNRAVKAITLHTFVDISLSYSYTHLSDHLRKLESPPDHLVLVCTRISWT